MMVVVVVVVVMALAALTVLHKRAKCYMSCINKLNQLLPEESVGFFLFSQDFS